MINVDELKSHPGVLSIYKSRVGLKKDGKELLGFCPLHSERTPSFRVSQHKGIWVWRCFGMCNKGGDIIAFIQATEGMGFKDAVTRIQSELGQPIKNSFSNTKGVDKVFSSLSGLEKAVSYSLEDYKKYEDALAESTEAKTWLQSRGINYETTRNLHIGFRQNVGKLAAESDKDLADRGWIAFPSVVGDRVLSIKYRSIIKKAFCKQPGMAKGDQTPLFNSNTIEPLEPVYVTEGELDAAVLNQAGFHAVSIQSASTPATAANKEKLLEADYVILAGDNDPAGNEYMNKLWAEMKERTFKLTWPCKDANETFLTKCGGDIKVFKTLVDNLTISAKSVPIPNISSLPDVMLSSGRINLTNHPSRLKLPWKAIDSMAVLVPGSVTCITATSSKMGKTCFIMQASLYAAMQGEVVLNYQCELSPEEFSTIVTAHVLRKDRNHLSEEDYKQASKYLSNIRYYIGSDPTLSTVTPVLDLIENAIRRLSATVVILDHIHFICRNEANEIQAQANAMQRIKRMAIQYGVKFIIISQPRKANQQLRGKLIDIHDIKGSETFGSDSDAVFVIHRNRIIDRDESTQDDYDPVTEVHLLGCRTRGDGGTFAKLLYIGRLATFSEMTKEEPEEIFK